MSQFTLLYGDNDGGEVGKKTPRTSVMNKMKFDKSRVLKLLGIR
jgi:hypothetical protein